MQVDWVEIAKLKQAKWPDLTCLSGPGRRVIDSVKDLEDSGTQEL